MLVEPNYTAAVADQVFFDPAKCARAASRACVRFRFLANKAAREGNLTEAAKMTDNLNWYRARGKLWRAMAKAEAENDNG